MLVRAWQASERKRDAALGKRAREREPGLGYAWQASEATKLPVDADAGEYYLRMLAFFT